MIATTDAVTIQLLGQTCARLLERNPRLLYRAFEMFEARVEKLTQAKDGATRTRSRSRRTNWPPRWARRA